MKKLLLVFLSALLLFSSVPATFAERSESTVALSDVSPLSINGESGYVEHMPDFMTVSDLLTHFRDKASLTVTDAEGNALALTDTVGTDAVISSGTSSVKTLVRGDVDGDAKANVKDAMAIVKSVAGIETDMNETAGDVTFDGKANVKDAMAILKKFAGWDVDLRDHTILDLPGAEADDADVDILFESIMNRVGASDMMPGEDHTYTLRMAKNELETMQFFLTSTAVKEGMTLEIGDIVNENGAVLEFEALYGYYYDLVLFEGLFSVQDYTKLEEDRFVDPLPKLVNPIDLNANESRAFYVKVKTTPETEAGLYKGTVDLKDADGKVVKTAQYWVYVWDFTLDEETASGSAFHLNRWSLNTIPGNVNFDSEEESDRRYSMYYDFMLENRLTAYNMPYDPLDSRADEYMSDPRVTSFCIAGGDQSYEYTEANSARVVSIYNKLRTNEDWLKKGYIYTVDEPVSDGLLLVQAQYEWVSSIIPENDFRIILPLGDNDYYDKWDMDSVEFVSRYINNWCPSSAAFNPYAPYKERREQPDVYPVKGNYKWNDGRVYETYGDFINRYESFRERGDTMWWYVCIGPEYPHTNFFMAYEGYGVRTLLWQQYMNDVDGLLYWLVNGWTDVTKNRNRSNGDGLLLYWGELFGQEFGPVSSVRLEYVRDGFEDFQYLTQLERLTDRDTSMTFVDKVTTSMFQFSEDYHDTENARAELGFYLESLYTK